ncbi:hypothetical protein H8959_013381 [Pygathrix nigripes]
MPFPPPPPPSSPVQQFWEPVPCGTGDLETIELTAQSVAPRPPSADAAPGAGQLEAAGRGESCREGLAGLAAPRRGCGRKRSRWPCGAGALTHGARERERERKG